MSALSTEMPNETSTVHGHLELALEAAGEEGMSTSELMGIFFYYAHSIAESYRETVMVENHGDAPPLT